MTWIDDEIPNAVGKYAITSEADENYNCIAWATTGATDEWWQHGPGYKWPTANRSPLIQSLVDVFAALGYHQRPATDTALEAGYEKVALYARNGFWTHAARQKDNGKWTSKLGPDEDIEHDTPACLTGTGYGQVHCIMGKVRT